MPSRRQQLWLSIISSAIVTGILVWRLADRFHSVTHALRGISWLTIAACVACGLVAAIIRSEAWRLCLHAAGATSVPRREIHSASAPNFLVGTLTVPILGPLTRIAILRRLDPTRAPTLTQMIAADSPALSIEAALIVILFAFSSSAFGLPDWLPILAVVAVIALFATLYVLRARFAHRRWAHGLDILTQPRRALLLVLLLASVIILQLLRMWLMLHVVGLHTSITITGLIFVASAGLNILAIGLAAGPAATLAIVGASHESLALAAGVAMTACWIISVTIYTILVLPCLVAQFSRSGGTLENQTTS
jgi:uncharacterized membrane protein YbhN (UPF0104 family)